MSAPRSVLFVCLGNICRSPLADGVMRQKLQRAGLDAVVVDSCGTGGWHRGEAPDARAIAAAARRGYDISGLRARQFEAADLERFDLVLAMDRSNLDAVRRIASGPAEVGLFLDVLEGAPTDEVPDPYYGGDGGFEEVLDLVEGACDALLPRFLHVGR